MTSSYAYELSGKFDWTGKILSSSVTLWFVTAALGQWLFAYYILVLYGSSAIEADWAVWTNRMIHGIIPGDMIGNIAVFVHILLAFVVTFCGPLQFIPQVRSNFPRFHRFNGRVYLITALIISVAAIYMIWSREAIIGGLSGQIGTSLDGVLTIVCAVMAWRFAVKRQIATHRKWALRLFIVASGVWFFRIIRGFWMFVHDGRSPGTNANLTGPFDVTLSFAGYLVPLLLLEIYFVVREKGSTTMQSIFAVVLLVLTIATAIGIYSAAQILWLPNL